MRSVALASPKRGASRGRQSLLPAPTTVLEQLEQALQVFKLDWRARRLAQPASQFLQDLACALDVDLVGHLDADAGIGAVRALRRPPQRVELAVVVVETKARGHLV